MSVRLRSDCAVGRLVPQWTQRHEYFLPATRMAEMAANELFLEFRDAWYPIGFSPDFRAGTVRRAELFGEGYAVFRTQSGVLSVLADRCPHRNVRLSSGTCEGEVLRCRYHGWTFEADGSCRSIPGLVRDFDGARRAATPLTFTELDGIAYVWPGEDAPTGPPRRLASPSGSFTEVRHTVDMPGPLPAVLENALDVPHTAFLHKGLFRTGDTNKVSVRVTTEPGSIVVRYLDEPRPTGIAGRILAPGGGVVDHWDRFHLPSTAEVEYRIGDDNQILISAVCAPVAADRTRLYAVVRFRTRMPDRLLARAALPLARKILAQDADILAEQTANVAAYGGESFSSTELDAVGPRIVWLIRAALRGDRVEAREFDEFTMET